MQLEASSPYLQRLRAGQPWRFVMSWRLCRAAFRPRIATGALALGVGAALVVPLSVRSQRHMPTGDPSFPRIRYADSLLSVNDRCAVRKNKLNLKVRPVYVNRQPIGFC